MPFSVPPRTTTPIASCLDDRYLDLYDVRSWDDTEIRAVMDEITDPACEKDTMVINIGEQSVIVISSPGPKGNEKRCGAPKTVVYRLTYPELQKTLDSGKNEKPK